MEIKLTDTALEHLAYFKEINDENILKKIKSLLENIKETPFRGIGKPEALKHNYNDFWSRRINREHRLIYTIENQIITVYSLKGHY